jgi:hypothetical protein
MPNPALQAINAALTNPQQNTSLSGQGQPLGAGGVAGVASNFKGPSIKIYKDQQKYQMWEFIFTMQQNSTPGQGGILANPLGPPGQNLTNPLGPSSPTPTTPPPTTTPTPGNGSGSGQP